MTYAFVSRVMRKTGIPPKEAKEFRNAFKSMEIAFAREVKLESTHKYKTETDRVKEKKVEGAVAEHERQLVSIMSNHSGKMDSVIENAEKSRRNSSILLSITGALTGLAIVAIGTYGVMAAQTLDKMARRPLALSLLEVGAAVLVVGLVVAKYFSGNAKKADSLATEADKLKRSVAEAQET